MLDTLFSSPAMFFSIPALLGTLVFLLKIGLMMLGGDADGDIAIDADIDLETDIADGDSTHAFSFISIQSIAAFVMGFGWGGLIGLETFGWDLTLSVLAGIAFGGALMWLLGLMLKGIYSLQNSGTARATSAVGTEGTVYAGIPGAGAGSGQVRVVVDGRARIYNAITDGEGLVTKTRVRVLRVDADNTMTVVKV